MGALETGRGCARTFRVGREEGETGGCGGSRGWFVLVGEGEAEFGGCGDASNAAAGSAVALEIEIGVGHYGGRVVVMYCREI